MAYNSVAAAGGIVANVAGNEVQTESQIKLQNFWELEKVEVEEMKPKQVIKNDVFKQQDLPLARIKKIMKLDDDLKNMMISAEAPVLFAKAAELFIREITLRAWIHTERNKRRTLQRNDIAMAVADPDTDMFDFLIDIVPREEVKPQQPRREDVVTPGAAPQAAVPNAAPVQQVQQPVQYVFQLPGQQCPQSIQILMPQQFQQQQSNSGVIVNGNGTAAVAATTAATPGTDTQMVAAGGGMQVVQLMTPQQQGQAGVVTSSVDGAASVVRQATAMPIAAGQQSMVVNAVPQAIQIQNLGGQGQPVILQQPTSGGVSSVCTVASVATAGAASSGDAGQAQEMTGQLSAVVGTASEVTVKTDPLEDESSSPTQEG